MNSYLTDSELLEMPSGQTFVFDVESYPNFFYVAFKHSESGKIAEFIRGFGLDFDPNKLGYILFNHRTVGFNSLNYDIPMVFLAMQGRGESELHAIGSRIINSSLRPYKIEQEFKVKFPKEIHHIDLIEVAPLKGSLKLYAGRLHCKKMQDLPYSPETVLTLDEARLIAEYCQNDLENTLLLWVNLQDQIELRYAMSRQYKLNLLSKSDAQIAEAVIGNEILRLSGQYPKVPKLPEGWSFQYKVPDYVSFKTVYMMEILKIVASAKFELRMIDDKMKLSMPKEIAALKIKIGDSIYKFGKGGLHSTEKKISHIADSDILLVDRDVESYYPRIILNQRLFPSHIGEDFLTVYEAIVNKRIEAKRNGDKTTADSLKITINGSFGKLGSRYSILYAPDLMIQVTVSGQLSLLMLIESLELNNIPVVSANTDGIVIKCKKSQYGELNEIIAEWERVTNFKTEETQYKAVFSRDVNNYIAVKLKWDKVKKQWSRVIDGSKTKGTYANHWHGKGSIFRFHKNPEATVCIEAVTALLEKGVPIERTILTCSDVTKFIVVRNVKGGAIKDGMYLGKTIRWYYAEGSSGTINYKTTGNKVPSSEGGKPMMELPTVFPADINYRWYINRANGMLADIGAIPRPYTRPLF